MVSALRTAWKGTCDTCSASIVVYPHIDREQDIPDIGEWEGTAACPVCEDGQIEWSVSLPVSRVLMGETQR